VAVSLLNKAKTLSLYPVSSEARAASEAGRLCAARRR